MQQQICPDQMSQQQQVMLCPVRLVYETQILVQPGEQIQPNQTLFINPQNPPPWIQNRTQNQVIYMQQLPNNIVPSVPQHMDQNQLYIQNYAYPQQMINQVEQMRQMPNVMTQNVMSIGGVTQNLAQNVNPSIAQNVGLNVGQNVMPMTNLVQNVQKVAPSYSQNIANDRVVYSSGPNVIASNAMTNNQMANVNQAMQERTAQMNQNLVSMQKVSELQTLRPQQTQTSRQPQVTVTPMQTVKFAQNVGDTRPMSSRPQNPQMNNINNLVTNMQANTMTKNKAPLPNKGSSNVMQNQVRHFNQTYYRPIQPRPMSVMPMVQNQYLPMQTTHLPRPQTQILSNELTRKRKSESPDESRKKIPNNVVNQTITSHNTNNINTTQILKVHSEIGINTHPVHRDVKPVKMVETASTGTQANIAKEKQQIDIQRVIEIKAIPTNLVKDNISIQTESDKLVRNTVFTQARGLLRTEPQILQPDVISIEKIDNNTPTAPRPTSAIDKIIIEKPEIKEVVKKEVSTKIEQPESIKNEVKIDAIIEVKPKETLKKEVEVVKEEKVLKVETPKLEVKKEESVTKPENTEKKPEKKPVKLEAKETKEVSKKFTVTAISDFKGNEIQIADGSVRAKDTDSYILTHVLDGYVIQESNMAFPIRKPLKEKTIYQNTDLGTEKREETYKHRTEDGKIIKDNSRILAISDLNLSEDDDIDKMENEEKTDENCDDHPFVNLTPNTIKSWTVDELSTHLSKYNWTETISVLSEHEIDGESLFLVSKPQLVSIGVSEEHAEVICEFIKK